MEVTKSVKQESRHFSDERFKTKSHTTKNVMQIFWEYLFAVSCMERHIQQYENLLLRIKRLSALKLNMGLCGSRNVSA